jgi:hypothetical protein
VSDPDAEWKVLFRGSEILSAKRKDKEGINLAVTGHLASWTLASAESDYEPGYRLELDVDDDTASALRVLFGTGPFEDADDIRYPIVHLRDKIESPPKKRVPLAYHQRSLSLPLARDRVGWKRNTLTKISRRGTHYWQCRRRRKPV